MYLYLVKMIGCGDADEQFCKIGVAKDGASARFSFGKTKVLESSLSLKNKLDMSVQGKKYISDTPYEVTVLHEVKYELEGDALMAEEYLLGFVKSCRYRPQKSLSGATECFRADDLLVDIVQYMDHDCAAKNIEAPDRLSYRLAATQVKEADPIKKHRAVIARCRADGKRS